MSSNHRQLLTHMARSIQLSDAVNFAFVSFLLLLCVLFPGRIRMWLPLVLVYLSMLLTATLLVWRYRGNPGPSRAFLRRWYPLAFVVVVFFTLGEIVHHVLRYDVDRQMIAIDQAVFGTHPTVFLSRFLNPYLVDLMQLCYASFYFLPLILGGVLYFRGKMEEFEAFAGAACLTFYLSFVGNILFPVSGPSKTLVAVHSSPIEGKWVGDFIREWLFVLEPYRWDCFPSGHVAVTLVTLAICYRFERKLFWAMLPIGTGLVASTVYLRYHYVVDIAAGAVLAYLVVAARAPMQRAWERIAARAAGD